MGREEMITLSDEITYKDILAANIEYIKELLPEYKPAQGDDIMLVLQALSYREMILREYINGEIEAMFLATASNNKLDLLAQTLYGLERLEGSKPYAVAEFSLLKDLEYDLLIPADYELKSADGVYSAYLSRDLTIKAGEISATGEIVLDNFVQSSKAKCEIPTMPLPYLEVKQLEEFKNGKAKESDEDFKTRIRSSLANKSTAGSALTYKAFALSADSRIEDIQIVSTRAGEVDVIYYSNYADEQMQYRIEKALNKEEVRPLTDFVQVKKADTLKLNINGEITIKEGIDSAYVYSKAIDNLKSLSLKIGEDLSIAKIIQLLMVDGVIDVKLNTPKSNMEVDIYSILLIDKVNISYRISNEL